MATPATIDDIMRSLTKFLGEAVPKVWLQCCESSPPGHWCISASLSWNISIEFVLNDSYLELRRVLGGGRQIQLTHTKFDLNDPASLDQLVAHLKGYGPQILGDVSKAVEAGLRRKHRRPDITWYGNRHPWIKLAFPGGNDQMTISIDIANGQVRVKHNGTRLPGYYLHNRAVIAELMKLIHRLRLGR
jgi:hypothetical protein